MSQHPGTDLGTGPHTVLEIAGRLSAGPPTGGGSVLAVAEVLYPLWQAFGERLREEENRGALYGIFWQVIGHADAEPKYNEADAYAKNPWDSFDEMHRAFRVGVAKGRALDADVTVHNRVAAAIAHRMVDDGLDMNIAASIALNETWQQATGGATPQFVDFP